MSETESKPWLNRKEAAAFLSTLGYTISPQYLSHLAANGNAKGGPPYTKFGTQAVRYQKSDLREWLQARTRRIA